MGLRHESVAAPLLGRGAMRSGMTVAGCNAGFMMGCIARYCGDCGPHCWVVSRPQCG